jgi:soluble lytic murein transglycosylase
MIRRCCVVFLGIAGILWPQPWGTETCLAGLESAVRKHRNTTVNRGQINKLAEFDHLIRYFTGYSYIVPRHKVNADFLRALILAESGADPRAVSSRDALGLAQIIYPTGLQASRELAKSSTTFRYVSHSTLKNLQPEDLFDPAVNILLACYLISRYNDRFKGRLDLVITAWNAGENTGSLSEGRHAPYQETENLIGKVNAYYVYLLRHRIFP